MKNPEIAKILYEIADLLELKAEQFKPQAYRKAARNAEEFPEDIGQLYAREGKEGLKRIPGVGEGIADRISEFIATGKLKYYEDLKKKFPQHISALAEVPGIGPKKIRILHEKLRIKTVDDLEAAAKSNKIAKLKGFGEKTEQEILKGIELVKAGKKRMLLGHALPIAKEMVSRLKSLPSVKKAVACGSLRRMQETVGDLDIVVVSISPKKIMDYFTSMNDVSKILAKGETKSSVLLKSGIQVDLRVIQEKSFGAAMQYFTGDVQHNVKLREMATRKGCKLNEYGIFKGPKYVAGKSEEEVYRFLGMDYIEPELRADKGEIDAAIQHRLPKLIGYSEVKGNFHSHTTKSDGANSLQQMVEYAKSLGMEYIAITDHSVSERIAGGLKEEEMEKWLKEIREFARKEKKIRVLAGSEVSIRANGEMDYPDELLKKMDVVVASVHSGFKSPSDKMTSRITTALANKHVDILGHPTGRLIHRREPYGADMKKVLEAAVDNKVMLEINAQPERMDLKDTLAKEAKEIGAKFVINTDAHSTYELNNAELGIAIARRAWLSSKDIVNTLPFRELPRYFRKIS